MANQKTFKYHFLRYDLYGALRPNWSLRLGLLFLCRHLIAFFMIAAMNFKGGSKPGTEYLVALLAPAYNVADIPAVILLYAMISRSPNAKPIIRLIWRFGRQLIFCSIALFLIIFAVRTRLAYLDYQIGEWVVIAGNVVLAYYVGTSRYIRDLFEDFPAAPETESEPAK